MRETDLVLTICEYLAVGRHLFWRQNVNPIFNKAEGRFQRLPKFAMRGIPDILVVQPNTGRLIGLEAKVGYNKLSAYQQEFKIKLEARGGIYAEVRSLEDVQALGL